MLFNSYSFIFLFMPAVVAGIYLVCPFSTFAAVIWLSAASILFYALGSPLEHVALLLALIAFNYMIGSALTRVEWSFGLPRAAILTLGLVVDLAALAYFKYAAFFLGLLGIPWHDNPLLPLGLSFFTFTQIAFIVDAYRGETERYDPFRYLLFVTYFPHLIAGPILLHKDTIPQFRTLSSPNLERIAVGLSIFAFGLAKKVLLADSIAPYADAVFNSATAVPLTMAEAWFGALAYAMQIYFDFSAYSDMAIGLSWMLGIRLPLNFNSPYKAVSIIDFWRRWHISLSQFLRNYLYIPLGGNRRGKARRYANLMVTMLIGGLWHGAGWTFVVWGGLHGLYLVINHLWRERGFALPTIPARILTFLAVTVAWVFFRAETFDTAQAVLGAMFGANGISVPRMLGGLDIPGLTPGLFRNSLFSALHAIPVLAALMLIAFVAPNVQEIFAAFQPTLAKMKRQFVVWDPRPAWALLTGVVFAASVLAVSGESPFLYFRF